MYIFISIVVLLFLISFIPHSMNLKLDYVYSYGKQKVYDSNYVLFKFLMMMPLKKFKFIKTIENIVKKKFLPGKQQINSKKNNSSFKKKISKAIYNSLHCTKLLLSIGFNLEDYVVNSYINAELNSILCIYINKNQDKFNLKNIYYEVYLAKEPVKIYSDIELRFTVFSIIKNLIKENKKEKLKYNQDNFVQNNKRKVK